MARIKMHIPKAKLPFYPPYEVKCRLQNGVSTHVDRRVRLKFIRRLHGHQVHVHKESNLLLTRTVLYILAERGNRKG